MYSVGRPELVFTAGSRANGWDTNESQFFIYESTGDDSFAQRYAGLSYDVDDVGPWYFARTAIGDPDGDGLGEILIAEEGSNHLIVIESGGDNSWNLTPSTWEYTANYSRDPWVLELEDVNDDTIDDVIVGFDWLSTPSLVILTGFAEDSYVENGDITTGLWGNIYSVSSQIYRAPRPRQERIHPNPQHRLN